MNVDSKIVWCYALAMKRINSTNFTEVVPRSIRMELVFSNRSVPREQPEIVFMNLDHERVFPLTDGAVTHGQFGEVRVDFEPDLAAVTGSSVGFDSARLHGVWGCAA